MKENEIWKQIPAYEDYQASNLGRIKNKHGKILNPWMNSKYLKVSLMLSPISGLGWRERQKDWPVHRLILMAFHGLPKKGQIGCHKNDVRTDNRLENLYWGDHKSNASDSIKNGTFHYYRPSFGEAHHGMKYSDEFLKKILSEYTGKRGEKAALERKYGLCVGYLSSLIRGEIRPTLRKDLH